MNIPCIRAGDYFIPDLKIKEEVRPIGKWGPYAPGLSQGTPPNPV